MNLRLIPGLALLLAIVICVCAPGVNAEQTEYGDVDGTWLVEFAVNDDNFTSKTPIFKWDSSTDMLTYYVDNGTRLDQAVVKVVEYLPATDGEVAGGPTSIKVVLVGPDGTNLVTQTVEDPAYIQETNNPDSKILHFHVPFWYTIEEEGEYEIQFYLYSDHDGLVNDLLDKYTFHFKTNPTAASSGEMWEFIFPLGIMSVMSCVVAVTNRQISLKVFLLTFGAGFVIFIYVGVFPWWMVLIPVLLLVVLFFGGGNDE